MRIGSGEHTYEWIEDWARIPDTPGSKADGRTHGVVVASDGRVIVLHLGNPAVLVFDAEGRLRNAWGDRFPGAHGLTLVSESGVEYLWLTDYITGEVAKMTLDGETVLSLPRPGLKGYDNPKYAPTWVAVFEERHGGNGDVWVADGYGGAFVHRYDKSGRYLSSLDGTTGAGRFAHPHGLSVDTRKPEPELYIADRMNRRIQVFDLDGGFKRVLGGDIASSACAFIPHGDYTLIPEAPYRARITILDPQDGVVAALGENDPVCTMEGFPNNRALVKPGYFVAPHSLAVGPAGELYVVEWITGGRITKLARVGC